jgi:hypothetical protein
MSHSAKHPAKPRLQDEEINPWNVEENIQPLGPDYVAYNPYQYILGTTLPSTPRATRRNTVTTRLSKVTKMSIKAAPLPIICESTKRKKLMSFVSVTR